MASKLTSLVLMSICASVYVCAMIVCVCTCKCVYFLNISARAVRQDKNKLNDERRAIRQMHFLQLQLHPTPWDRYITNLHVHVYILSCRESFYLLLALCIMRVDAVVTCNLAFTKITKQANNTITFFCIMWASSEIKYQSDQSWMSLSAPTCYPREATAWQACCIRGQHPNLLASTCSTLTSSPMVVWITW